MFANLTGMHALVILAVVLLLFGAAKLPALARSIGQSMRILREESAERDRTDYSDAVHDAMTVETPAISAAAPTLDDIPAQAPATPTAATTAITTAAPTATTTDADATAATRTGAAS